MFLPVESDIHPGGVTGGIVERSTPEAPPSITFLKFGIRPASRYGPKTLKVIQSMPRRMTFICVAPAPFQVPQESLLEFIDYHHVLIVQAGAVEHGGKGCKIQGRVDRDASRAAQVEREVLEEADDAVCDGADEDHPDEAPVVRLHIQKYLYLQEHENVQGHY